MRFIFMVILTLSMLFMSPFNAIAEEKLMLFCGAAFKKPMEEIIGEFKKTKGIEVNAVYGGVRTLFSQIMLSKRGDIFVVPSVDIMDRAKRKGLVIAKSIKNFAYVVPSINVQKGNPLNITDLKDLTRPGIKVAIANPETVYTGAVAVEIIEKNLTPHEKAALRKNIVTYGENLAKLATYLSLKQVDAIIGFTSLEAWYGDKIETVQFKPKEIIRIGAGQAGIITYSKNKEQAQKFVDFLLSDTSRNILKKYHYFVTPEEAFKVIGEKKPIGGEYEVPVEWVKNK